MLIDFVCCICGILLFFFSSRRRHTRSTRDWSSDVCSSDPNNTTTGTGWALAVVVLLPSAPPSLLPQHATVRSALIAQARSEERRVGKECRSRWWPEHEKQKHRS